MHTMHAVLVEKILRVQPDATKIYLLVRGKDASSAKQRVQEEVITSLCLHFSLCFTAPVNRAADAVLTPVRRKRRECYNFERNYVV